MTTWEEYWSRTPPVFKHRVLRLRTAWRSYIESGFDPSLAEGYCKRYCDLLSAVIERRKESHSVFMSFLASLLGFENFVLSYSRASSAFACATASFRNPVFLSLACRGLRKHARNDPRLLALVVGLSQGVPAVFYHYRKQRILKNTDESILFFPAVDLERRRESFRGLQTLTTSLAHQWDSRVEQRSNLLAYKILIPLLMKAQSKRSLQQKRALRILDIGSGAGLFTSKVTAKLLKSGALTRRKMELHLVDILTVDPKRHFRSGSVLPGMSKIEYISNDYSEWIRQHASHNNRGFDIALVCRMLHNISLFRVVHVKPEERLPHDRYPLFRHLSDYYRGISLLFPETLLAGRVRDRQSGLFCPCRAFNPRALVARDRQSLIQLLTRMSAGVLIEDGDLSAGELIEHMVKYKLAEVRVYDLSRALRLSINHIYWITKSRDDFPLQAELIWPR